jgi:hypothetical protein
MWRELTVRIFVQQARAQLWVKLRVKHALERHVCELQIIGRVAFSSTKRDKAAMAITAESHILAPAADATTALGWVVTKCLGVAVAFDAAVKEETAVLADGTRVTGPMAVLETIRASDPRVSTLLCAESPVDAALVQQWIAYASTTLKPPCTRAMLDNSKRASRSDRLALERVF